MSAAIPQEDYGTEVSRPRVSVIIPAYNAARFLARALASVLAQTVPVHEILVVDDGSTDETAAVARRFGGPVRCLVKPNGGPASARNVGIRAAEGDWLAFLDADDQWLPDKLEKQFELVRKTGADLVSADAFLLGGSSSKTTWLRHTGIRSRLEPFLGEKNLPNPFEMLLRIGCFLLPTMVLVRKECLVEAGLFDEQMHGTEDIDLWLRLALRWRIALHPDALAARQIHQSNVSGNAVRMVAEKIKVWEKLEHGSELMANPTWLKLVQKRKAEDYWHQGYWMMHQHRLAAARESWRRSLHASFSPRVAAYWLATYLPESTVYSMRGALHRLRSRFVGAPEDELGAERETPGRQR